jgi:serine/threonine protein kinase
MEGELFFLILCKQPSESRTAAHDDACFNARILHRDISVGNIFFTEDNKGMLIDWDLCADMDTVAARRPARTASRGFTS